MTKQAELVARARLETREVGIEYYRLEEEYREYLEGYWDESEVVAARNALDRAAFLYRQALGDFYKAEFARMDGDWELVTAAMGTSLAEATFTDA